MKLHTPSAAASHKKLLPPNIESPSTPEPSAATSRKPEPSTKAARRQRVTRLTNEDLSDYNECIAKEYANRLLSSEDEGRKRAHEVSELKWRIEDLTNENETLNRNFGSLEEEHDSVVSKNLDIAIRYNALQHELADEKELSEKRTEVIELARTATVHGEIPWKRFLEAADELRGEMEEGQNECSEK